MSRNPASYITAETKEEKDPVEPFSSVISENALNRTNYRLNRGKRSRQPRAHSQDKRQRKSNDKDEGASSSSGSSPDATDASPISVERPFITLWTAAREGKCGVIRTLMRCKGDIEAKDEEGFTALMHAANAATARFLVIEAHANVETKGFGGVTALIVAAGKNRLDVVKFLVCEAKAQVEAMCKIGTALAVAAMLPRHDIARFLIEEAKANVETSPAQGGTALFHAASQGNVAMVRYLVGARANVETASTRSGFTPLMVAASFGRFEVVKYLIEAGADTERRGTGLATALEMIPDHVQRIRAGGPGIQSIFTNLAEREVAECGAIASAKLLFMSPQVRIESKSIISFQKLLSFPKNVVDQQRERVIAIMRALDRILPLKVLEIAANYDDKFHEHKELRKVVKSKLSEWIDGDDPDFLFSRPSLATA